MKILFFLLLAFACALADNSTGLTTTINVTTNVSCPGDVLSMNATTSDGIPVPNLELRLILYLPYQGLRAIEHTDNNGLASVQLTYPGDYRVYILSSDYIHDNYVEFQYPTLCPPPPPVPINLTITPDCNASLLLISASANGTPLNDAFISTQNWSSLTSDSGNVSFPLYQGEIFINASKDGYAEEASYFPIYCPPGCFNDSWCNNNQSCVNSECVNLSGVCGYPSNHSWINYQCCSDSDCQSGFFCQNNSCIMNQSSVPVPVNITNNTINNSLNPTKQVPANSACSLPSILLTILILKRNR